ncbi:MAG: YeaC family protein, partial [Porticoccaceae bacterium]|nr:YeaC family protein [Porticoccaceae bacterium]
DFQQLLNNITPDIYQNLKRAVELGKWPDGNPLTAEQKELCMQAVIAYECKHLPPQERSGYVPPKPTDCDTDLSLDESETLKWKQ